MIAEEIIRLGEEMTDAPRLYLEATAWWVLSSTIGRSIVIPYLPRPPENPARPNVWVVISGMPGIMRKSTVIEGIGRFLVRRAWEEYISRVYPEITPKQAGEKVASMFIETGSYEGIAKHISETQENNDTYFIVSPEWGGVLQTMRSRDYMIGLATLLSKLYSGEEHLPRLVRETRYIRPGLYVTAILGMQEPWLYLDNIVFRQGLMRRVIFIYQTPEDKSGWKPPLDLSRGAVTDELSTLASRLARLMDSWDVRSVEARMERGVVEAINSFARETEAQLARGDAGNWGLYAQNLWEHATKIAVLHAADRQGRPEESGLGHYIMVTTEDAEYALDFIRRTIPRAREALSAAGVNPGQPPVRIADTAEALVEAAIAGKGCVTASELLRATRMMKEDLKTIVSNMLEKERIHAYYVKRSRGRPSIWFCLDGAAQSFATRTPGSRELTAKQLESIW